MFPLFSLWELGNLTIKGPVQQVVEEAIGPRGRLAYVQLYTPFIKGMDERVPLVARPHLLTCWMSSTFGQTRSLRKFGTRYEHRG